MLVLVCVLAGLCVVPSLAHADAAADYRAAVLADNPVSFWRLNDTSGSTAVDEENRNPGQISGATLNEPGPMAGDASMRFAGNGIVELGHDESLRPPESWTLELWFKASASEAADCATNFGPVCDMYRYHAFGFVLQLQTDGQVSAGVDTDNQTSVGVTSPDSYADNQWHYAVVVRSQGNLSLFIDGSEVADTPTASPATYYCCEDVAAIANDGACHCESFTGWLSEVAFYNYALSATQIEEHYAASGASSGSGQTGLVSEWRGNGNANDSVGTSNGTLVDGGYAPGRSGQAFNFDGVDDYVSIPSTAMANVTGAISVSAWVNPVSLPTTEGAIILSQYDTHDTETSFDIELMPGGHIEWEVTGAGCDSLRGDARVVESTSSIVAGQWTQVTGTYDPATEQLEVLINGQSVATQMIESAGVPSLCRSNTPLRIGAAEAIGGELADFFDGEIEDVQLYNTDISGSPSAPVGGGNPTGSSNGPSGCIGIWCGTVSFGGSQGSSCPDVAIFGARGSGEDNTAANVGMGPIPYQVGQEIRNRLPVGLRVEMIGVNYPAVSAFAAAIGTGSNYLNSVVNGAEVLVEGYNGQVGLVSLVKSCPKVAVVLVGLSQGAHVIHYAMSLAPPHPSGVTSRIAAVLLFGDPVHQPNQSYNVGSQSAKGVLTNLGPLPGNSGPPNIVSYIQPVTQSYCLHGDPICESTTPGNLLANNSIHSSYGSSPYIAAAASFAVNRIKAAAVARAAVAGTQSVFTIARASRTHTTHTGHKCLRRQTGLYDAISVCPSVVHGMRPQRRTTYGGNSRDGDRISMTASNNAASVAVRVLDRCGAVFTGRIIVTPRGIFDGTTPGGFEITGLVTTKRIIKGTITDPGCKNLPIRSFVLRRQRH